MDPRAEEGYFVGYETFTKGYRIWIPTKGLKFHVSRDVFFDENSFYIYQPMKSVRPPQTYEDIAYIPATTSLRLVGEEVEPPPMVELPVEPQPVLPELQEPQPVEQDLQEELLEQVQPEPVPVGVKVPIAEPRIL